MGGNLLFIRARRACSSVRMKGQETSTEILVEVVDLLDEIVRCMCSVLNG